MSSHLTKQYRNRIRAIIYAYNTNQNRSPSISEIAAHLGIKKGTAYYHISCMLNMGELENRRNSPRSLKVRSPE